ncbi:MAG: endonuclease [Flavobacteriaceae bacterium]
MKRNLLLLLSMLFISISIFSQQAYYNDVNLTLTGTILRDELGAKVTNTHTNSLSYTPGIWEASRITDQDPNNSSNVVLIYGWEDGSDGDVTNDLSRNKFSDGGNVGDWNREHTFANSLANPDLDASGTSGPPYADAHNLRPCDVQRNGQRGSLKFATGSGNSGSSNGGWYPGDDTTGGTDWRGDVARIIMYMYIRYDSQCNPSLVAIGSTNSIDANMIDLLLDWNASDPVSSVEDARNTYHESGGTYSQGNRNPFIDEPYLATLIWGGTPAEDRWGIYGSGDTETPSIPANLITSNPTSSTVDLTWTASTDNVAVTSYDIYVDGSYDSSSATNSHTVTGLASTTTFTFTVLAKDAANNVSAQSASANGTTLEGATSGSTCLTETFENIPASSSSYATQNWTGDNGSAWEATDARTDQTLNTRALTIRNGILTAPTTADGIETLTVTTMLVFSGSSGTFDLNVNGIFKGTIPYGASEQTTVIPNIDVTGSVTIVFDNNSSGSNRVMFDDLTWTCFSALAIDDYNLENIRIYPNPASGSLLTIDALDNVTIAIFDILGKQILKDEISRDDNQIDISRLNSGIYLIRLQTENGSATKKFIKR